MRTLDITKRIFKNESFNSDETLRTQHEALNILFQRFIEDIWPQIPDGAGKTFAFRHLQLAKMSFDAAIDNSGD